ncbi:tyrosine recombinase XerC [Chitinilyticum litopenaei]|uniref:tyrosine recombinase XerC n=1 Tax=Chitinilyticum litopenaei TaxID=1121276 RepID=UPI0003F848E3|nr:tyrosine recombinase XerC [Chitinilyticum litopenaei]
MSETRLAATPALGQHLTPPSEPAVAEDPASAFAHFFRHLQGERMASAHTLAAYRRDLGYLAELAREQGLATLTPQDIRGMVRQLAARKLSGRSIARILSAWRAFYRLMSRDFQWPLNPVDGVRPPKSPKRLPETLVTDAASGFLDALPDDEPLACRDKAICELAYSSGLRVSELAGLRLADLDLVQGEARVLGKGSKTRLVPVGRAAIEALRRWLLLRPQLAMSNAATVFVSQNGTPLTTRAIQLRLQHWQKVLGLPDPLYPHKLRHSCASHLLQSSGDLRAVQELLGHASIATTQVYTHLDFQHLAKVYDAAHPRAKKPDEDETPQVK